LPRVIIIPAVSRLVIQQSNIVKRVDLKMYDIVFHVSAL